MGSVKGAAMKVSLCVGLRHPQVSARQVEGLVAANAAHCEGLKTT